MPATRAAEPRPHSAAADIKAEWLNVVCLPEAGGRTILGSDSVNTSHFRDESCKQPSVIFDFNDFYEAFMKFNS